METRHTTRYFNERSFDAVMGRRSLSNPRREPPEGWSRKAPDPMLMLEGHPLLRIREGWRLRAYQYYAGGNGNAAVFALPARAPFPEPKVDRRDCDLFEPPLPEGVARDFMSVIEGDGTPESYLSASFFARDTSSIGAYWHGCSWQTHGVIFEDPLIDREELRGKGDDFLADMFWFLEEDWEWRATRPKNWRPRVTWRKGGPCVTFFTHSPEGCHEITRYTDCYGLDGYTFETEFRTVATGPGGITY